MSCLIIWFAYPPSFDSTLRFPRTLVFGQGYKKGGAKYQPSNYDHFDRFLQRVCRNLEFVSDLSTLPGLVCNTSLDSPRSPLIDQGYKWDEASTQITAVNLSTLKLQGWVAKLAKRGNAFKSPDQRCWIKMIGNKRIVTRWSLILSSPCLYPCPTMNHNSSNGDYVQKLK